MSWTRKEHPHPLDTQPIDGLFFLMGDAIARQTTHTEVAGEKYPLVQFPSGVNCSLHEGRDPTQPIVHLDGEMDLPLYQRRDEAFQTASEIANLLSYIVRKRGEHQIEMWTDLHLLLTYDNTQQRMVNVEVLPVELRPKIPLLDEATRQRIPPLFSQEKLELNALVQVKFFDVRSNWTWYATEASALLDNDTYVSLQDSAAVDPHVVDIVFFGLVNGYELELGSFTLSELEASQGPLGLGVERDKFFTPTPLKALQEKHQQERRHR
jgi:hypothetical protein